MKLEDIMIFWEILDLYLLEYYNTYLIDEYMDKHL